MKNNWKSILAFIAGAGIGSVVTWKYLKDRYRTQAEEEIAEVREYYKEKLNEQTEDVKPEEKEEPSTEELQTNIYKSMVRDLGYNKEEKKGEPMAKSRSIYVISPDEVGDYDYDVVTLTYYADNVLTYDDDTLVEDVEHIVGWASLETFGEYEDDCVYVRNDVLKTEYEICKDLRKYSEVVGIDPDLTYDNDAE